jgi:2-polyprenyl-6-methoxyphenol hydroxylase-like FAD-dependent oxidoreductase
MRGDIEDVLYEAAAPHAEIRFGRRLVSIDQDAAGVTATFDDRSSVTADLLIGADGLHSTTRSLMFGPESHYQIDLAHMVAVFTLNRLPDGVQADATTSLTNAGRTLAIVNNGKHGATAFFGYRTTDQSAERALGAAGSLRRAYADMGWVVPAVLNELDHSAEVYFDSVSQVRLSSWRRGRVVVIGDAAWCVTLFAGFGSSLAVAGSERLGAHLEGTDDLDGALAAWESEVRPEAEAKQLLGRRVKGLYAPKNKAALFIRDLPLRTASIAPIGALLRRRLQIKG